MNKLIPLLALTLFAACSQSGGGSSSSGGSSPSASALTISATSNLTHTNLTTASVNLQLSQNVDRIRVYKESTCSNVSQEIFPNSLTVNFVTTLDVNQKNNFYFSALNEASTVLLSCQKKLEITQDQIAPATPPADYFFSQSGTNTSNATITTGGVGSEFSESIQNIRYYLYSSSSDTNPVLILQSGPQAFLAKTITLPLSLNSSNLFKYTFTDLAGNESQPSRLVVINQTSSSIPPVILDYEVLNKNNTSTNQANFILRGFANVQSTGIDIYQNEVLISSITSTDFNSGVPVLLQENVVNTFKIINKQNTQSSTPVIFTITHDTILPVVPTLDPQVYINAESDFELDDSGTELFGTTSEELSGVEVYTDSGLTQLQTTLNITNNSFNQGVAFYTFGTNTFYLVSVDKAGNKSSAVSVSFNYLDYNTTPQ